MSTQIEAATPAEVEAASLVAEITAVLNTPDMPSRALAEAYLVEALAMLGVLDGRAALAERLRRMAAEIETSAPPGAFN